MYFRLTQALAGRIFSNERRFWDKRRWKRRGEPGPGSEWHTTPNWGTRRRGIERSNCALPKTREQDAAREINQYQMLYMCVCACVHVCMITNIRGPQISGDLQYITSYFAQTCNDIIHAVTEVDQSKTISILNKPNRAKMRLDCVLTCIDFDDRHVRYMEGQIEGRTDR